MAVHDIKTFSNQAKANAQLAEKRAPVKRSASCSSWPKNTATIWMRWRLWGDENSPPTSVLFHPSFVRFQASAGAPTFWYTRRLCA